MPTKQRLLHVGRPSCSCSCCCWTCNLLLTTVALPTKSERPICVCVPVQSEFCVAKGYKADCEVIYGDTDSVMVNFKVGVLLAS
jgi:DNA polymerase elongation subunit (family B)